MNVAVVVPMNLCVRLLVVADRRISVFPAWSGLVIITAARDL
jgi:hypothetical protein